VMSQHAIPQQISSYEFKLVGEMTLKQFLKAAIGVILAVAINSTKLIFFIKWPLIAICAGGGLALAFVPFQDRPLETWIGAFLKSIYSPTIFLYKKRANLNWLDIDMTKANNEEPETEEPMAVKSKDRVKEFIESLPSVKKETAAKDTLEENLEAVVKKMATPTPVVETIKTATIKPEEIIPEVKEKNWKDTTSNLDLKTEKLKATGQAVFGAIPMPDIPDLPNLIVGMVTDKDGKIVEGAIVEVQDAQGNPARVLKTNPLGQFKSSTQLTSGKYLIITEKDGFVFDRVSLDLTGQLVKPIKILAK
jgi:hypothetical protein